MAAITLQTAVIGGLEATYAAASSGGDYIQNDGADKGRILLHLKNGATDCVVTIDSVTACDQGSDHNGGGTCTASEERIYGPFNPDRFNDSSGRVQITYDDESNVTVAAIVVPLA